MCVDFNIERQYTAYNNRKTTRYIKSTTIAIVSLLSGFSIPVQAQDLATAISNGKISGQLRYRYETVDEQSFLKKAQASTLRTRLGYSTGNFFGFSGFIEFEDITIVGNEHFNSSINGLSQFPVVADPEGTEINQSHLTYLNWNSTLKYGRQVLAYDNHRFVGDVGWRQNQQTFDAFSITNNSLPQIKIAYAHVTNVNRIFGERHPTLSDVHLSGDLINIQYAGLASGTLVGYGYFIDYDPGQPFAVTASHKTLGLRYDGNQQSTIGNVLFTAELAQQRKYKDGASTVNADYFFGMIGLDVSGIKFKLNFEKLQGNGTYALQTPFATLHAFNGWADKFLTTPVDGLLDTFVSAAGSVAGINLLVAYHDFSSDNLSYQYGTEWDFSAGWKATKQLSLLFKYAQFDSDKSPVNTARNPVVARDVTKTWLQAEYQF